MAACARRREKRADDQESIQRKRLRKRTGVDIGSPSSKAQGVFEKAGQHKPERGEHKHTDSGAPERSWLRGFGREHEDQVDARNDYDGQQEMRDKAPLLERCIGPMKRHGPRLTVEMHPRSRRVNDRDRGRNQQPFGVP
jgi:hypothetical protein